MAKKKRGSVKIAIALVLCIISSTVIGCDITNTDESPDTLDDKQDKNAEHIAYDTLSDFLTDEQIAVYETADLIFPLFHGHSDDINDLPHDTGYTDRTNQKIHESNGYRYASAEGEYQDYTAFKTFCLSAFTDEYFDALNGENREYQTFIEHDGRLYYVDADKGGAFGYNPDQYPDTYELISRTDTEIRFYVIGYYQEIGGGDSIYSVDAIAFPITMVLEEDGWRFSQFSDPAYSEENVGHRGKGLDS